MAASSKSCKISNICHLSFQGIDTRYVVSSTLDRRNKPVGLIYGGLNKIQVLYQDDVKLTYTCLADVSHASFDSTVSTTDLWISTATGDLHRISVPSLRTGKKKGKGKSSKDVKGDHGDGIDVFNDLLRSEGPSGPVCVLPTSSITVGEDSALLSLDSRIDTFQILENHVAVVSDKHTGWLLTIYGKNDLVEKKSLNPIKTAYFSCAKIEKGFVLHAIREDNIGANSCLGSPILFCIYPPDSTETLRCKSGECGCVMEKNVFNKLFGEDTNLAECPVLLVALPDGQIYSVPVRDLPTIGAHPAQHLLCHLGQTPVSMCGTYLHGKEDISWIPAIQCNCLLIQGQGGKLLVIAEDTEEKIDFKELQLQGPVVCASVHPNWFFHSSGKDLFVTALRSLKECKPYQYVKSQQCGLYCVAACCVFEPLVLTEPVPRDQPVNILVVTKKGRVSRVELDLSSGQVSQSGSSQHSGQRLRELLTSIQQVSSRLGEVQARLGRQDTVLTQLGLASVIASVNNPSALPVQISTSVTTKDLGSHMQYQIALNLTNVSPVTLDQGWSLSVNFQADASCEQGECWNVTRCANLKPMTHGEFYELLVSVPPDALYSLPIIVSTVMTFCMKTDGILSGSESDSCANLSGNHGNSLCVPVTLPAKSLDIMDFLASSSTSSSQRTRPHSDTTCLMTDIDSDLKFLADNRPSHSLVCLKGTTEEKLDAHIPHYCAHIHLRSSTVQGLVGKDKISEALLLRSLLNGCPLQDAINGSHVKAYSPGHQEVSLAVKAEGETSNQGNYVVVIQTPNLQLLCQLRSALLHRIITCQNFEKSPDGESVQNLRRILQDIEDVNREAASLQEVVQGGIIPTGANQQTMRLYERLRKLKLAI